MKANLSDKLVKALKAAGNDPKPRESRRVADLRAMRATGKPFEVRDTDLNGFILRVQPTGRMSYIAQLGRGKRITVGSALTLTPEQGRSRAKTLLAKTTLGEDVQATRRRNMADTLLGYLDHEYGPWLTANRKDGAATLARLRSCFLLDMGNKKLTDISPWLVEKWRSKRLKAGRRPSTVNRDMGALKAALARAVEWGLIDAHPIKGVKPSRIDDNGKVRYLSPDEEARLRQALSQRNADMRAKRESANRWREARDKPALPSLIDRYGDHLTPAVLVSLNTGLRRGELLSLTWDNVNLGSAMLTVVGETAKSARTRHIPLNNEAKEVLRRWKVQTRGEGLVFQSHDGKRMDNMKTAWRSLLKAAGIASFRWHDMRHHFASALVMRGADLYVIKELLGHSTIAVTERYAHLAPEHKAAAVALLDQRS